MIRVLKLLRNFLYGHLSISVIPCYRLAPLNKQRWKIFRSSRFQKIPENHGEYYQKLASLFSTWGCNAPAKFGAMWTDRLGGKIDQIWWQRHRFAVVLTWKTSASLRSVRGSSFMQQSKMFYGSNWINTHWKASTRRTVPTVTYRPELA